MFSPVSLQKTACGLDYLLIYRFISFSFRFHLLSRLKWKGDYWGMMVCTMCLYSSRWYLFEQIVAIYT